MASHCRDIVVYSGLLLDGRSGDLILLWARFSAPVKTGLGAHPVSCIMGTWSFPGVKLPGRGVNHPPPFSVEFKERVELYLYTVVYHHGRLLVEVYL